MSDSIRFTIEGTLPSMKNNRPIAKRPGGGRFLAPSHAMDCYAKAFALQVPSDARQGATCDLTLTATIYYPNRRHDLDGEFLCDLLQRTGVIQNDRQIKEKHFFHGLDKERPRVEVEICLKRP